MGRVYDAQQFIDGVRHLRSPTGLATMLGDVAVTMGFDGFTLFQHVNLSGIASSLAHMRRGELVGMTTAPVSWSEYYRDNNFVAVDPRVLATRRTAAAFRTGDTADIIPIGAAQRRVIECQQRARFGEGLTIPLHFPGEPSASCTFTMRCGRALPEQNFESTRRSRAPPSRDGYRHRCARACSSRSPC